MAFRQVRHAAEIVGRARGVATVAAVEVLSQAGWDRSRDPGSDQDASDGESENPFHRFRPTFRPSVASSRRTLRAARPGHGAAGASRRLVAGERRAGSAGQTAGRPWRGRFDEEFFRWRHTIPPIAGAAEHEVCYDMVHATRWWRGHGR